ncbi:LOW QUALITY PROTEIN: vomeronasal type-2 receptor 116-like [Cervus canadensis]|uniref:LOW QUALITY PROTEIN: vomeronasal type-2 receptor 116-like n=1 Tax=Cervus canadensis TaxID=1574408 RepID=UPI001C9E3942|nr:LOW QUALITY PROTEIN: vomeronasal type-2 receptor 116-like [Cervus canadensis]
MEETIVQEAMKETLISVCSQSYISGFRKTPQEGQPVCCFTCALCPERYVSNHTEQCAPCPDREYLNRERNHCLPRVVTFLAFEDSLGMSLTCTALCFCVVMAAVLWVFVKHRDTPLVKANNRALSHVLLISLLLCVLCSLLFINHPHTATCVLQQITLGAVFTVAVATVLAKTLAVIQAFKARKPGRTMRRLLVRRATNYVFPMCSLIQVIICGVWLGTSPPFLEMDSL